MAEKLKVRESAMTRLSTVLAVREDQYRRLEGTLKGANPDVSGNGSWDSGNVSSSGDTPEGLVEIILSLSVVRIESTGSDRFIAELPDKRDTTELKVRVSNEQFRERLSSLLNDDSISILGHPLAGVVGSSKDEPGWDEFIGEMRRSRRRSRQGMLSKPEE